jgi:hypothetical protein
MYSSPFEARTPSLFDPLLLGRDSCGSLVPQDLYYKP